MRIFIKGKLKSLAYWLVSLTAFLILFPSEFHNVDARSAPGHQLRVHLYQASPAMAALEEVLYLNSHLNSPNDELPTTTFGAVTLNSGRAWERRFEQMVSPKMIEPKQLDIFNEAQSLMGLRISSSHQSEPKLPTITLASATFANPMSDGVPRPSSQMLLAASGQRPTWQDKAKRLVNQEMEKRGPDQRVVIPTQSGQPIMVMAPTNNGVAKARKVASATPRTEQKRSTDFGKDSWIGILPANTDQLNVIVAGRINLPRALHPSEKIKVYYAKAGHVVSEGTVWDRDLTYEIAVEGKDGFIFVDVMDSQNHVLFEGNQNLEDLDISMWKDSKVASLELVARKPEQDNIIVSVESGYSFDKMKFAVDGVRAHLLPFGVELEQVNDMEFKERDILRGSVGAVEVTAPDHWPTQMNVMAGKPAKVRIFHENLIDAFLQLIGMSNDELEERPALVWGVIKKDGKPVEGAQVEIESYQNGVLSYFEFNLPTRSRIATDSSGQFVWIAQAGGTVSVRVTYEGQRYAGQVVETSAGVVSWVDFEYGEKTAHSLQITDFLGQADEMPRSSVRLLGSSQIIDGVTGRAEVKMQTGSGQYLTEVDPGRGYHVTRVESPMTNYEINHLLVPESFTMKLKAAANRSDSPQSGTLLGLFNSESREIYVYDQAGQPIAGAIYFNEEGKRVEAVQDAIGYVFFNMEPGQYAFVEMMDDEETVFTKLLNLDSNIVTTISRL